MHFATKKDAAAWIKEFGDGLNLKPEIRGRYRWVITDKDGHPLSEERLWELEDKRGTQ